MPTSTLGKIKDWSIKGFQLQKTYIDDWEEMKKTFFLFGLDINFHGPLITLNEVKMVRIARILTRELSDELNLEKKDSFLLVLRTFPKYARIKAEKEFVPWLKENYKSLLKLQNGTMKDTDSEFEKVVRDLIGK